jgi:RNA polymerase sigma factor (sigma-70 family)
MNVPLPRSDPEPPSPATELVRRAIAGDPDAWTTIVRRYEGLLWSVARGFRLNTDQAADAVQVTWLRLFENIDKIRDHERLTGWLSVTMRRECIRAYRDRPDERLVGDLAELTFTDVDGADVDVLRAERDRLLWAGVDALPARQRDLLHALFDEPTSSYDQVSATLNLPVGSIGPIRMRALRSLHRILEAADVLDADLVSP